MLDRNNECLMSLLNNQLARPTGGHGLDAFRPLGWMIRGIDTWTSDPATGLAQLQAFARQGVLELYGFLLELPNAFGCSPEEFVLGYRPAITGAVPKDQAARLETWYGSLGTVFRWLDVPQGDALNPEIATRFVQELGGAITDVAGILVPAQEGWSRIRARLG